ncbi:hypothetical protein [Microbacterium sp. LBN7]|uniref:hypothetical protein n=1 Tax=Microbacterium sp. LBN7 TaxID=3129773 RepID=UPI003255E081
MSDAEKVRLARFVLWCLPVIAALAVVLGFSYRFLFLGQVVLDRGPAARIRDAFSASAAMFVVLLVASIAPGVAFRVRASLGGKIVAASISGLLVYALTWFSLAQVGGFPLAAGSVTGATSFFLLICVPRRSSD